MRKKPRRDAYPNEFETKDQFCPGCDLELKTMPLERTNLYLDVFLFDHGFGKRSEARSGLLSLRIGIWSGTSRRKWRSTCHFAHRD